MRTIPLVMAVLACLAGCKSKVARPSWSEGRTVEQAPAGEATAPEPDAGAGEVVDEQEAERVGKAAARPDHMRGILEVLGDPEETAGVQDVFGTGELSEEELEAIEKAVGTIEDRPPPPPGPGDRP